MDEIALEMRLKQRYGPVVYGAIDEIVDQQICAHARRHAEDGGQTEGDGVAALQHRALGLHFRAAVKSDGPQLSFFRAEFPSLPDTIAAVGNRHHDSLLSASQPDQRKNRVAVGAL